jgi:hypothetical protein
MMMMEDEYIIGGLVLFLKKKRTGSSEEEAGTSFYLCLEHIFFHHKFISGLNIYYAQLGKGVFKLTNATLLFGVTRTTLTWI